MSSPARRSRSWPRSSPRTRISGAAPIRPATRNSTLSATRISTIYCVLCLPSATDVRRSRAAPSRKTGFALSLAGHVLPSSGRIGTTGVSAMSKTIADTGSTAAPVPRPGNHVIVMFGATGDLARRKLLPGLYHLAAAGLMPDKYQIIGSSRRAWTDKQFREHARQAIADFGIRKPTGKAWQDFQRRLSFASSDPPDAGALVEAIATAEREIGESPARLFHLAIPPTAFEPTVTMIGDAGLAPQARVIIEKPFGTTWLPPARL